MSKAGAKAPVDEDVPVGPGRLSNSILIWAVMSFSMLYISSAAEMSTTSLLKSTFMVIAFGPAPLVSSASEPESEPVGALTSSATSWFSRLG